MNRQAKFCDTCGNEIRPDAKMWELRGIVVVHNGATREIFKHAETCSANCLLEATRGLVREATEVTT